MNFFEAQDNARKATRRLMVAYFAATVLIVAGVTSIVALVLYSNEAPADPALLAVTAAATALVIVGATLFKTAKLSSGGGSVARELGGTQVPPEVQDPLRRRLRNVVEEMSIAAGVPVPEIYVLERESGINAFAAGFAPGDAAIAVTRGTLEMLTRDELQGVVAHEFSHILNGDMRLNMRMMGVLFGIMVLGLIGRLIVHGSYHGSIVSSRRSRGAGGVVMIGVGLLVLGWIGVFMARIIKAAVSRQREYLADASAVQFTRQTDGIADALKKIAGFKAQSFLQAADPEEVSHMLFSRGSRLSSLLDTHPPLIDRIRALQPGFNADDLPVVEGPAAYGAEPPEDAPAASRLAGDADRFRVASISETVGQPSPEQVAIAGGVLAALPEALYSAAHAPGRAWLLTLALFVQNDAAAAERAFELLRQRLGEQRYRLVRQYHDRIAEAGVQLHLPLLEIAFPALRATPVQHLEFLLDLCRRLVELDGTVDLHEFCMYRILERSLGEAVAPLAPPRGKRASRSEVREAAIHLLCVVADRGNARPADKEKAFLAGRTLFGEWAGDAAFDPGLRTGVEALERNLDVLQRMNAAARRSMVDAMAAAVSADGLLTAGEGELLRAVCASLNCPLPPLQVAREGVAAP
jgi:Zn-dependent protease with chaperone function